LDTCGLKKKFQSIAANCLKISNRFSEVLWHNDELSSILWHENCNLISAFCSCGARIKVDVTKCEHDLESSSNAQKNSIQIRPIACTSQEI
jgi:hypothetical protein